MGRLTNLRREFSACLKQTVDHVFRFTALRQHYLYLQSLKFLSFFGHAGAMSLACRFSVQTSPLHFAQKPLARLCITAGCESEKDIRNAVQFCIRERDIFFSTSCGAAPRAQKRQPDSLS